STVATVMLTGAFHEDGLADVADGLGGSASRERALEIMKDSRIGAFGAVALVLALGLKFGLLAALAARGLDVVAVSIVGAHVLSRLAPLFL
ncbi:adenosylcobinamide-GDP ribazoletransferase, partial [Pseudomonas sp. FW300-N1A1]